jgi:hypothetical protein
MPIVALYAVGIHNAICSGDIKQMKAVLKAAEKHLGEYGDIRTAVEMLKVEIAKAK